MDDSEIHDNVITLPAREAKVNIRDADDVRGVGVHNPCHESLRTAFTSDDGVLAVLDPESTRACEPDADAVPIGSRDQWTNQRFRCKSGSLLGRSLNTRPGRLPWPMTTMCGFVVVDFIVVSILISLAPCQ